MVSNERVPEEIENVEGTPSSRAKLRIDSSFFIVFEV